MQSSVRSGTRSTEVDLQSQPPRRTYRNPPARGENMLGIAAPAQERAAAWVAGQAESGREDSRGLAFSGAFLENQRTNGTVFRL